ncbi:MAG: hypothetical protein J1D89_00090 [Agathobacter sp.]|nr:hypothetical protein [Agathobacter sp.]
MAITPINNVMIPRSADMNLIKHQEDTKPQIDQQNIQVQVKSREEALSHQVLNPENSEKMKNDADARDEGKGKYSAGGRRKKDKKDGQPAGGDRVIKKQGSSGFDIKV